MQPQGISMKNIAHIFSLLFANYLISEKSNTNGARNTSPMEVAAAPKAEAKRKDFGDPMLDDFKDHYNVIFIGHVGRLIFYLCTYVLIM